MAVLTRILNADGYTQIDERYSGLGVTAQGNCSMVVDTAPHPNPMKIGTVTVTGENPVLAIAAPYPTNIVQVNKSGNQFTFHLRSQAYTTFSIPYWVFDNASLVPLPPAGTPKFEIRHPTTGAVVFHSHMKPLRLIDSIQMATPADGWNGTSAKWGYIDTRTMPGGRTWAVIQGSYCFRSETYDGGELRAITPEPGYSVYDNHFMHSASSVNGNEVEAGLFTFEDYQNQQPTGTADVGQTWGNLSFWIVDVTGYGGGTVSADYTPAAVNWSNISLSTTSNTGSASNSSQTITGIDQTITLRATVSGYSGNLSSATLNVRNSGGTLLASRSLTSTGYVEFTATNGTALYFDVSANTSSGSRSGSATVTVQNMSDRNLTLDTFTVTAAVDTDNNYNLNPDTTPVAVNWSDIYESAPGSGYVQGISNTQTIQGIEVPITLRVSCPEMYVNGSADNNFGGDVSVWAIINGTTSSSSVSVTHFQSPASRSFDFTVNNGDTVQFYATLSVYDQLDGAASGTGGGVFTVTNLSDGSAVLDPFTVTLSGSYSGMA